MKKVSIPDSGRTEWRSTGSLMNKPAKGWIHTNAAIDKGVTYTVKYIGCVKILQSVKSVSLEDRSNIIRIAMAKCCDKAGLVKQKKKPKVPPTISKAFGDIFTGYCGENVLITISKSSIRIVLERTGVLICDHYTENISFASAGEKDYSAYVSYIAKDNVFERASFVIECALDMKAELIQTIGQAFEAKYKDYIKTPRQAAEVQKKFTQPIFPEESPMEEDGPAGYAQITRSQTADSNGSDDYSRLQRADITPRNDQQSHYDKLGKGPEYAAPRPDILPFGAGNEYSEAGNSAFATAIYDNPMASPTTREQLLIDFNDNSSSYLDLCEEQGIPESMYDNPILLKQQVRQEQAQAPLPPPAKSEWEQFDEALSDHVPTSSLSNFDSAGYMVPKMTAHSSGKYASLHNDSENSDSDYQAPQDYQLPKHSELKPPQTHYQAPLAAGKPCAKPKVGNLCDKAWFHGNISRVEAEMLIEKDGLFLVRESSSSKGQYVLSGMKDGQHRHLLLVDPEGQVRTKDRKFATVEELIAYHRTNSIPIISGGSDVHILTPVVKAGDAQRDSFKI